MSNIRYLEIDSTYRNRNDWPLPGKFEVPISQTGRKNITNAVDPVSLSVPLTVWTSYNLNLFNNTGILDGTICMGTPAIPIGYSSDTNTIIIKCPLSSNSFQKNYNYYEKLVIIIYILPIFQSRITEYVYLYTDSLYDVAQITLDTSLPDTIIDGTPFKIRDPTDISDKFNPYIYVPSGRYQDDSYNNFILYNESVNEYREVINYNSVTHMAYVDTNGSNVSTISQGPITNWKISDNFSIRKEVPYIDNSPSITIQSGSTNSTIIIDGLSSSSNNFYKNYSLRILPLPNNKYNYSYDSGNKVGLIPPINESCKIISSLYDSLTNLTTVVVYPPFSAQPQIGSLIEIMSFSYDNLYPFVYTGSLVSQNEMVCYEIQLLNIVIPNSTLTVGEGGRIAFYPYIYVQLSNVSAAGAGLKNVIYSNNPNATNVTFRVPIYDIQNPSTTTYLKVDGDGMTQTIKFKPNDTLLFSVTLQDGQIYQTELSDTLSPSEPDQFAQISALFSIKRL